MPKPRPLSALTLAVIGASRWSPASAATRRRKGPRPSRPRPPTRPLPPASP